MIITKKNIYSKNLNEIIAILVYAICAFAFNVYRVQGDGLLHFGLLEKTLGIPNPEPMSSQLFFFQSGCMYFNMPFYLVAYAIEKLFHLTINLNGITLRQVAINLASNFYLACSLFLVIRILKKLDLKYVLLPTLSILFSTSAFACSVVMPSHAHTVDVFIHTVIWYLIIVEGFKRKGSYFALGVVCGLAVVVRYMNIVYLPTIALWFLCFEKKEVKKIFMLIVGFVLILSFFPVILYTYNATPSPFYKTILISKVSHDLHFLPQYFGKVLWHPLHGLWLWAPVSVLSCVGLIYMGVKRNKYSFPILLSLFLFIFLHGYISDWYAGWSFTNRYVTGLFPILVIGLSVFLHEYDSRLVHIGVYLMLFYSIFLYFNWALCIINGEFGTPFDMGDAWISGQGAFGQPVSLGIFIQKVWRLCRLHYLGVLF